MKKSLNGSFHVLCIIIFLWKIMQLSRLSVSSPTHTHIHILILSCRNLKSTGQRAKGGSSIFVAHSK